MEDAERPDARTEVRVLGRFGVRTRTGEVPPADFGGRLPRRLLRLLATRRGEVVARDTLIQALWPQRPPSDPDANLNVLVSRARGALGDRDLIETSAAGYALVGDGRCEVDCEAFLAAAARGHAHLEAGRAGAALRHLTEAFARWGEPLPEDAYEDWAQPFRTRLTNIRRKALEDAAEAALAVRDPAQALEHARTALRTEPLSETAAALVIRALAETGDRASALATYEKFRRRLARELGVDPSAGLRTLHERVLRDELPVSSTPTATTQAVAVPRELEFVGRGHELASVLGAVSSRSRPVIVSGTSGAGKSRLLREVERRSPLPVVAAGAFVAERDRSWSFARTLLREALALDVHAAEAVPAPARRALSDLLPELAVPPSDRTFDAETRRSLRSEGAVRLLETAGDGGLVLLLDDLQWADPTSLELLEIVISRIDDLRPVLAFRPEEVGPDDPLIGLREDLHRSADAVEMELGPLPTSALTPLIGDDALRTAIAGGTEAFPLAVVETITALAAAGLVSHDGRHWRISGDAEDDDIDAIVTRGHRRSIGVRVGRHPRDRRELLALLALLGRGASPDLLAHAVGRDEGSVLADLDRLHTARLVRVGDDGWHAAHDRIAETVADDLEPGHRADLHRRLAEALSRDGRDPAEIARHLAGAGDTPRAAATYGDAARMRLDEHASREARELADTALSCGPGRADRAGLLEVRAEARARTDDLAGARADLRAAIVARAAGPERARSLARLATLESGAEDLERAEQLAARALTEAGQDRRARAAALSVAAIIDVNLGEKQRGAARAEEALRLFSELGDARGVADILDGRAMATFLEGRIVDAVAAFDRVADDFEDQGELLRVITPRSTRGHGLVFMDRAEVGLAEVERALDLARTLGHAEGITFTQWHRSEALAAVDRVGDAEEAATEALEIARQLGHRGWTATALLGLGTAHRAAGDHSGARAAFREALDMSHHLPLFSSWAASRLGLLATESGRSRDAAELARRASRDAPGLASYEAQVLTATLAVHDGRPDADRVCRRAIAACRAGGHHRAAAAVAALQDQV